MTWINRENAPSNLPTIKDLRGAWVNGQFDIRMAGGCNIFGYDTTVWDKTKQESKFMFSTAQFSDSIYHKLADKLVFRDLQDVYFAGTSGSDANEAALRAAFKLTNNFKIATREGAWHGATLFSSTIGNHPWFDDYTDIFKLDIVRKPNPFFSGYKNLSELVESDIEFLKQNKDVGTFLIEPLPGSSFGFSYKFDRPDAYNKLRKYCDDNGILLIFDEVMSGFKTGKKYFSEYLEIDPDFITLSKGITAGVIPFSVVLGRKDYFSNLRHGHTWSGNYLGAVAANHTIDYFYENVENGENLAQEFGHYFDFVLGSIYSISNDKVKTSKKIIDMFTEHPSNKVVLMIPSNTLKNHFKFVINEILK